MTSHPDNPHHALAGCGQRLKQAREAAGMSIDDVAARLHMPARIVRSLEAEDWSRLGAPVFVRGQVRSYSRLMGLVTAPAALPARREGHGCGACSGCGGGGTGAATGAGGAALAPALASNASTEAVVIGW